VRNLDSLDFVKSANVSEACAALSDLRKKAVIMAGGTDIMPEINSGRFDRGRTIVYIGDLLELKHTHADVADMRIGSLVTAADILDDRSAIYRYRLSALYDAAYTLGSPQVRNRATLGGNVATASPSGDLIAALIALNAELVLAGPEESRMRVEDILTGAKRTCLGPEDLIARFIVPLPTRKCGSAFIKEGKRKAMSISIANVACALRLYDDGETVKDIRIAIGACAPTVVRASELESALKERSVREAEKLSVLAREAVDPITDGRAGCRYRLEIVPVLVKRAVAAAVAAACADNEKETAT
jgi:carbon-monoxide dehydrogenase medium subunit